MEHWWGMGWFFGLAAAAFWVLVVLLVVGLIRGRGGSEAGRPPALKLLEERYARGEISREEFTERRDVLLRRGSAPADPRRDETTELDT